VRSLRSGLIVGEESMVLEEPPPIPRTSFISPARPYISPALVSVSAPENAAIVEQSGWETLKASTSEKASEGGPPAQIDPRRTLAESILLSPQESAAAAASAPFDDGDPTGAAAVEAPLTPAATGGGEGGAPARGEGEGAPLKTPEPSLKAPLTLEEVMERVNMLEEQGRLVEASSLMAEALGRNRMNESVYK